MVKNIVTRNAKLIFYFGIAFFIIFFVVFLFFGNPQKYKALFIIQKYYLKRDVGIPKNYNGLWREWNENGKLLTLSEVKNGLLNGENINYDPQTGDLLARSRYQNGKLNGKQEFYFKQKLDYIYIWGEDPKNIQIIWFYENGNEAINCFYKNDAFYGEFNCFYENGNKKLNGSILNNKPINEWPYWEDNKDATKVILNAGKAQDLKLIKELIFSSSPRNDVILLKIVGTRPY